MSMKKKQTILQKKKICKTEWEEHARISKAILNWMENVNKNLAEWVANAHFYKVWGS